MNREKRGEVSALRSFEGPSGGRQAKFIRLCNRVWAQGQRRNRNEDAQGRQSLRPLLWHREIVPSHRSEKSYPKTRTGGGLVLKEVEEELDGRSRGGRCDASRAAASASPLTSSLRL